MNLEEGHQDINVKKIWMSEASLMQKPVKANALVASQSSVVSVENVNYYFLSVYSCESERFRARVCL